MTPFEAHTGFKYKGVTTQLGFAFDILIATSSERAIRRIAENNKLRVRPSWYVGTPCECDGCGFDYNIGEIII